jgi:hypothetical protein
MNLHIFHKGKDGSDTFFPFLSWESVLFHKSTSLMITMFKEIL